MQLKFRDRLTQELEERRKTNPRYSLRAFARFLDTDHSSLSQILRGKRSTPTAQLRQWAKKLGLENEEAAAWIAAEQLPEPREAERERQLRHWTAEAVALAGDRTHWLLLESIRTAGKHPDSPRIAAELGVTTDRVNMAFTRMLSLGLLSTSPDGAWRDQTPVGTETEKQFLRLALSKIRAQAAEFKRSKTNAEPSL